MRCCPPPTQVCLGADTVADVLPESRVIDPALASLTRKSTQDGFVSSVEDKISPVPKSSKTTEATSPTGGVAAVAPLQNNGSAGARVQTCAEAAQLRGHGCAGIGGVG